MAALDIDPLLELAWACWERGLVRRQTRVGAAARADDGTMYGGCNVQQRFHTNDIHAEVNAITTMIAEGRRTLAAIAIVAELQRLAPCGGCLDWIIEFGGDDCVVACQGQRGGVVQMRRAAEFMPFHPEYE
jgi:cytidine deaminase